MRPYAKMCLLAAACLLLGCSQELFEPAPSKVPTVEHKAPSKDGDRSARAKTEVPERVMTVLKYIDEHHTAPKGHEGGREFRNAEQRLPKRDNRGESIRYQEWDVNAKVAGRSRDAERLVTGSNGSAYYTADHYRTFTKIR